MKKLLALTCALLPALLTACAQDSSIAIIGGADGPTSILISEKGEQTMYQQITQEHAKTIMDSGEDILILDVREQDEYDAGHIPGAVLLPHGQIDARAAELPEDRDKPILVYCRSGRRSKLAAESLVRLGYTAVLEFGGINDWPYEVVK